MRSYVEDFIRSREEDTRLEDVRKLFKVFNTFKGSSSSGRTVQDIRYGFERFLEHGALQKTLPRLTVPEMREVFEDYLRSLRRRP